MRLFALLAILFSCNCVSQRQVAYISIDIEAIKAEQGRVRKEINDLLRVKEAIISGDLKIEGIYTQ